jgi:hypothetical protein
MLEVVFLCVSLQLCFFNEDQIFNNSNHINQRLNVKDFELKVKCQKNLIVGVFGETSVWSLA